MIIDQLTPLRPKDNKEVNGQVKHLQAMLDIAILVHSTLDCGERGWGQDADHHQSPCGDLASSTTPHGLKRPKEGFAMTRLTIQKISEDHGMLLKA
jgi:hypothetical protein